MHRKCACGHNIIGKADLCNDCLKEYGADRAKWPDWLKFLINDMQKELRLERQIDKHEITFTDLGVY